MLKLGYYYINIILQEPNIDFRTTLACNGDASRVDILTVWQDVIGLF
jgi:hypothetical protein